MTRPLADGPDARPPWQRADLLPERPPGETYGYVGRGQLHECAREELPRRAQSLAWVPEQPRLLLPTEVPDLGGVVRARLRTSIRQSVLWAIYGGVLAFGIGVMGGRLSLALVVLALVALPSAASILEARAADRALSRREGGLEPWYPDFDGRFHYWVAAQRATFTLTIAAGIALCAVCQLGAGLDESVAAAGVVKDRLRAGEPWRLLTGTFLHGGIWHLFVNLGALFSLGGLTEALGGPSRLALVYLGAIAAGSLASLALLPSVDSVGASGGLMGVLGFLITLAHRHRSVLPPGFLRSLLKNLVWVAAAGVAGHEYIDNAAHAGGLLMGAACGRVLAPAGTALPVPESGALRRAGWAALVVLCVAALATAVVVLRHEAP